jgi:hypothetical protein
MIGQVHALTSDTLDIETAQGRVRGAFLNAHHMLFEGPCTASEVAPEMMAVTDGTRTLIGTKAYFDRDMMAADLTKAIAMRQQWLQRRQLPRGLPESRRRTLGKAISTMKGQVCTPEKLIRHCWTTPDRWPHRDLWLWDSVFHAIGWRHLDQALARQMIEAVFDGQQEDGRVPHQLNPLRVSDITQPPILAFGMRMVMGTESDRAWIEELFPRLERYLEWDLAHRIPYGEKLAQWKIDDNPLSRCAESGMDNSPRFDRGVVLGAVDFNAYLSLESRTMAEFACDLGRQADAQKWLALHRKLNQRLNEFCWDEALGFYFDYDPVRKARTGVYAASGFLPMLCGAAGEGQAKRMATLLAEPRNFGTAVPVASALMEPSMVDPQDMWRGPMWANMNWLIAEGLEASGHGDAALQLRLRTLDTVEHWYLRRGSLFEFYDETGAKAPDQLPRKGKLVPGSTNHQVVHDYGWTATVYTDLAFRVPPDEAL